MPRRENHFFCEKSDKVQEFPGCIFQIYTFYGKHFCVLRRSVCYGMLVPSDGTSIGQCPMSWSATSRSQTRLAWSVHRLLKTQEYKSKAARAAHFSDASAHGMVRCATSLVILTVLSEKRKRLTLLNVAGAHRWGVVHFRVARRQVGELSHEKLPGWSCQ